MKGLCYRDLSLLLVRDKELSGNRRQQCGSAVLRAGKPGPQPPAVRALTEEYWTAWKRLEDPWKRGAVAPLWLSCSLLP